MHQIPINFKTAMFSLQLPDHKLFCSRTVTSLVKILYSGPTHGLVQFDCAGYMVRRSTQQANLTQEKHTKNCSSRHCNRCVVSCLTTFNHSNKLYSSLSQPSTALSGVSRSLKVFCKSLQHALPAALVHELLINRLGNHHLNREINLAVARRNRLNLLRMLKMSRLYTSNKNISKKLTAIQE